MGRRWTCENVDKLWPELRILSGMLILQNVVHRAALFVTTRSCVSEHTTSTYNKDVFACMLALLLWLCLYSSLLLQHNHELCRFQWTAAAPLKSSQSHWACPFEKAVPQSLYRLVWFNTRRKKKPVYAIFSIHSTDPYYNVYVVALSFNLCVGKLAQSQRRQSHVVFPNAQRKKKIFSKPKDIYPEVSTRDVILSENALRRVRSHWCRLVHKLICLVRWPRKRYQKRTWCSVGKWKERPLFFKQQPVFLERPSASSIPQWMPLICQLPQSTAPTSEGLFWDDELVCQLFPFLHKR